MKEDMTKKRGEAIIRDLAKQKGVPVEEVRLEMKKAILEGYRNPETRTRWNEIFGDGHIPEPEEFIVKMADQVRRK